MRVRPEARGSPPRGAAQGPGSGRPTRLRVTAAALALLVAAGASASVAARLAPTPYLAAAGSEAWMAGWLLVFAALAALYSYDRLRVPTLRLASRHAGPADRRPSLEQLLAKKPGYVAGPAPPTRVARPPVEDATGLEPRPRRGAREAGAESFSVVDPLAVTPPAAAPPSVPGAARAPAARVPPPAARVPPPAAPDPPRSHLGRCAALRREGRFEEAGRVAREGLAGEEDPGPLLVELSRAELALGRVDAALDTARDAHFAARSRESARHLIALLTETRRFGRQDGAMLRRAVVRHPAQPLLRHALGVFERLHGEPAAAERELAAALGLEADPVRRAALERDLAWVRAASSAADGGAAG